MKRSAVILVTILAACGDTTSTPPTQLNLDRPVDVAFACYGGLRITGGGADANPQQDVVLSAQPLASCEFRSAPRGAGEPIPTPPGQQDLSQQGGPIVPNAAWYALILQKGPGMVAIAEFATKAATAFGGGSDVAIFDADPLTPGKNSISIGEEPIGIITDTPGCSAVTANAGSCDLSVLDLTTALDRDGAVNVMRLEVTNSAGEVIRAKPAAIVGEPKSELIGVRCPAQELGEKVTARGLAYIAYPSCHVVAGVNLETGRIEERIQFDALGVPTIFHDGNVSCPDECGGGASATPGSRPVAIDLEHDARTDARRLVIGSENASSVAVVELDFAARPISVATIALEGNVGVTALALSPVIGVGGQSGQVDDENGRADYQFVYAVATDQTVRVVEVHTIDRECDTQVDPRFLRGGRDAASLGCMPVGDAFTPPRRAGARGPGIELGRDQIPVGVDFMRSEAIPNDQRSPGTPSRLIGHFAVISSASGETFTINVDDDDYPDAFTAERPLAVPATLATPHAMRDAVGSRSETAIEEGVGLECDNGGPLLSNGAAVAGPRTAQTPARNIPAGLVALEKSIQLPGIRQLKCEGVDTTKTISELGFQASEIDRDLAFPDLRALATDEQWTLTWEGSLSIDRADTANDGPVVREAMLYVDDTGMHLRDQTKAFCDAGAEPFDIVQMRGCDPSLGGGDCPIGYACYVHPQSQVQGIGACMLADEAERLADACKDFLTSIRRYTVAKAESGELLLLPRRHELRLTPLDGCIDDAQCERLGDLAIRSGQGKHPGDEASVVDNREWVCRPDPMKAARGANNRRCNMACDVTSDCASGTVCIGGNTATQTREGLCMEGVVPPQACVNSPQRFEIRAGEAFVFAGTRNGYVHPIIADANKTCVKDPNAHPLMTSRIPIAPNRVPACDPNADPVTGRLPAPMQNMYDANPCSTTIEHFENLPRYVPGTCTLDDPPAHIVSRMAPAIRYRSRGMTFHIVDPTYPGDQTCLTDRLGPGGVPLVNVPQVFHGYSVSFRQVAGFQPLRLPITPVFPVKVVRGPLQSMWVVDEGDFLSTSIAQPSTRGKVFRIEAHNVNVVNILE